MTLLAPDLSLFGSEDPVIQKASRTHRGMAHFAGTGPSGKTCRECANWVVAAGSRAKCKAASCSAYRRMMNGRVGQSFPAAAACKYFEAMR